MEVLVYNNSVEGDFGSSVLFCGWGCGEREKKGSQRERRWWKWILNQRRRRLTSLWRFQKNRYHNNLLFLDLSVPDMGQVMNSRTYSQIPASLTPSVLVQQHGSSSSSSFTLLLPRSSSTSSTMSCPCPHKSSPATSVTSNSPPLPSETMASKSSLMVSWYCINPNSISSR